MTPSQIDHLRLIDAHCAKLLSLAEKRTPGEWVMGWNMIGDGVANTVCNAPMRNPQMTSLEWVSDKQFIAACAGNAEAGWRATRAAIVVILNCNDNSFPHIYAAVQVSQMADFILAAFPLELVQKT